MLATMNRKRKDTKVKGNQLLDLEVERVDGVDRPATGRKFILFKNGGPRRQAADAEIITGDGRSGIPGRRTHVSFADVLGVTKSQPVGDGVREFMPGDQAIDRETPDEVDSLAMENEDARMGAVLQSWSGRVAEVREVEVPGMKAYARDSFLYPTGGLGQPPIQGYVNRGPSTSRPDLLNFPARGLPGGLAAPADFRAPVPGDKTMGDGYVLKSTGFWTSVLGPQATPTLETIERMVAQAPESFTAEEHAAVRKAVAKGEGTDRGSDFPLARQHKDDWLYAGR
jgi:hypothetical protein